MTEEQLRKARCAVKRVMRGHFPGVDFDTIEIEPGVDHYGDEVLFITAVFDDRGKDVEADRMISLYGALRPALESEAGTDAFPSPSYVAKSEWDEWLREQANATV